jgi:hypothetical protein
MSARKRGKGVPVVERESVAAGEPRQGAIHGTGVQVEEAETLCERRGNGALSRAGRAVDGDDHVAGG